MLKFLKNAWPVLLIIAIFGSIIGLAVFSAIKEAKENEAAERREACMIWTVETPTKTYKTRGRPVERTLWRGTGPVSGSVQFTDHDAGGTRVVSPPYTLTYIADEEGCK